MQHRKPTKGLYEEHIKNCLKVGRVRVRDNIHIKDMKKNCQELSGPGRMVVEVSGVRRANEGNKKKGKENF